MRGDNVEAVPSWVWDKTYTAADPLTVTETPAQQLDRQTSRDVVLLAIAGMVIIAILAWLLGRAS